MFFGKERCIMMPDDNCKHKQVTLWPVIKDLWKNCENQGWKLLFALVFFIVFMILAHFCELFKYSKCDLSNVFVTVFSCLLGFAIAGYAILLSLGKEIICVLTNPFEGRENEETKESPFKILSATFSYCCLILLLTVITSMFYNHNCITFNIIMLLASYSFILVFDLILHLYTTSYYLVKCKEKRICKKQDDKVEDKN